MTDVHYLVFSAALAWLMIMTASTLANREWTMAGMKIGFSNRDAPLTPSPIAGRADRAAKNMLENMVVFVALFVAARARGASSDAIATGAAIFFFARFAYWIVYLIGIPYLRTLVWSVSLLGFVLLGRAALMGP